MYAHRQRSREYSFAALALVASAVSGAIACESAEDATKNSVERSPASAKRELRADPSIVVCHPEIVEVFKRLGATPMLLGADSDSRLVDGMSHLIDLGPGCGESTRLAQSLTPLTILSLGTARIELNPSLLAGAEPGLRQLKLDPRSLDEIVAVIRRLGDLAERGDRTRIEIARITHTIGSIAVRRDGLPRLNIAWIIDTEPITVVGPTGLLHELLELAGGENAFHDRSGSRLEVTAEEIGERSPDMVLVPIGSEELAKKLELPTREFPLEFSQVPTLAPVKRLTALHELLYPND